MNFFSLRNGVIILSLEIALAFAVWPESTSAAAQTQSDRQRRNQSLPDYSKHRSAFVADGGNPEMAFLDYAKEILTTNRKAGLEHVLALADRQNREDLPALFGLITEERGLAAALAAFPHHLDDQLQAQITYTIAVSAAATEPRQVIAFLKKDNPYLFTDDLILGQLLRSDLLAFDEKIEVVRNVPPGEGRRSALDFLAQEAAQDRRQNERVALENSGLFTQPQLDFYSKIYGHRLLATDLSMGLDYLREVGYQADLVSFPNLREYGHMSAQKDWQETLDSIAGVSDQRIRTELTKGALDFMTLSDPTQAVALAQAEFDGGRDNGSLLKNVYSLWFDTDTSAALNHLKNSNLPAGDRDKILTDHFASVAQHEPLLAQQLINQQPAGEDADALRASFATTLTNDITVTQRLATIAEISQESQRDYLAQHTAQALATFQPREITSYLENSPSSAFKDQVILGFTRTAFYEDVHDFAKMPSLIDQVQDAQLQNQLLTEWYQREAEGDNAQAVREAQLRWEAAHPNRARKLLEQSE